MTDYRWVRLLAYVTGLVNQKTGFPEPTEAR